jgi:hypothetical protein
MQPIGGCFHGRGASCALGQIHIEARGLPQRNREDREQAVQDVSTEDQGNFQTRFFDCNLLNRTRTGGAEAIEETYQPSLAHSLRKVGIDRRTGVGIDPCRRHETRHVGKDAELPGLFLDRHPGKQRFDIGCRALAQHDRAGCPAGKLQ